MTELLRIAQEDFARSHDPNDWYQWDDDGPDEGAPGDGAVPTALPSAVDDTSELA